MSRYAAARSFLEHLGLSANEVLVADSSAMATWDDVSVSVKRQWKEWQRRGGHPDKNGGNDIALRVLQEAYDVLKRDFATWLRERASGQDFNAWCKETDAKEEHMSKIKERAEKGSIRSPLKSRGDDTLKAAQEALSSKRFEVAVE